MIINKVVHQGCLFGSTYIQTYLLQVVESIGDCQGSSHPIIILETLPFGDDAAETQLPIPGDQFAHTDYMQKQLKWMSDMEERIKHGQERGAKIYQTCSLHAGSVGVYIPTHSCPLHGFTQESELPEVPSHATLTRRGQFQTKRVLKEKKEEKKQNKENEPSVKAKGAKRKSKGKASKRKSRAKKTAQRKAKAKRVLQAKRLRFAEQSPAAGSDAQPSAKKAKKAKKPSPPKAEPSTAATSTGSKGKASKEKEPKDSKKKGPKPKGSKEKPAQNHKGTKASPKAKAKSSSKPKGSKNAKPKNSEIEPDEALQAELEAIYVECQFGAKCDCHSADVQALTENHSDEYTKVPYWHRRGQPLGAVGVRGPTTKGANSQFAYFSGGPCAYVNLAVATAFVKS